MACVIPWVSVAQKRRMMVVGEVGSSVVAYAHETHTWKGVVQALDDTVGKGDCCQVSLIPRTHIGGES